MITTIRAATKAATEEAIAAVAAGKHTQASRIASTEYETTFMFGDFKLEEFCTLLTEDFSAHQNCFEELITDYTTTILSNRDSKNVAEVTFVQPNSSKLLQEIMGVAFSCADMRYDRERNFICHYKGTEYKGDIDHVLLPTVGDAAVLVWEDKKITYNFKSTGDEKKALCQVAVGIYAEANKLSYKYNINTEYFCGILTNGTSWYLVAYYLNHGFRQWRHSNPICTVDDNGVINKDSVKEVAIMLRHALASAKVILKGILGRKISATPHLRDDVDDEHDDENDDDDGKNGDSGKGAGTDQLGALSTAIATTLHVSSGTRSNGKGNQNKVTVNSSGSTGGKRSCKHALLLTIDRLAEHNKENYYGNTMPWRLDYNFGTLQCGTTTSEAGSMSDVSL